MYWSLLLAKISEPNNHCSSRFPRLVLIRCEQMSQEFTHILVDDQGQATSVGCPATAVVSKMEIKYI